MKVKNSFKEKKNVQMNFLNPEQIDWQPNLSIKDKKLQLNQHNVEKKDCSTNVNIKKKILKMDQQTIICRQERLANQHQYQNEKNVYSATITDEIRKFHATVQSTFALYQSVV